MAMKVEGNLEAKKKKPLVIDFLQYLSKDVIDETSLVGSHSLRFKNRMLKDAIKQFDVLAAIVDAGIGETNALERLAISVLIAHVEHVTGKTFPQIMKDLADGRKAEVTSPHVSQHVPEKKIVD